MPAYYDTQKIKFNDNWIKRGLPIVCETSPNEPKRAYVINACCKSFEVGFGDAFNRCGVSQDSILYIYVRRVVGFVKMPRHYEDTGTHCDRRPPVKFRLDD